MQPYTIAHLDPLFTRNFSLKLQQYRQLGCLPEAASQQDALITHTLQLLHHLHPVLTSVLDAELLAGNKVQSVCDWPSGPFYINLLRPFSRRYKARHLYFLEVNDPRTVLDAAQPFCQYATPRAPRQFLTANHH